MGSAELESSDDPVLLVVAGSGLAIHQLDGHCIGADQAGKPQRCTRLFVGSSNSHHYSMVSRDRERHLHYLVHTPSFRSYYYWEHQAMSVDVSGHSYIGHR